jgi:site-specific DNA-methyltransferase (adenine-specific)
MTYKILHGNNLDILPTLGDNSIDSIVTDPPYELGFMGKKWDSSGIAYSVELWQQCLRVLKPGGHLLSFGGTRTYHRVAVAIEDAGFELRDSIAWLYGSGFPKSLDVSKAIDKAAGAEREVVGDKISPDGIPYASRRVNGSGPSIGGNAYGEFGNGGNHITAPSTLEAQQWQGWGTALKPAFEPVIVARKPIEGTVANNVLKWGTGGLNIDGSRIAGEVPQFIKKGEESNSTYGDGLNGSARTGEINTQGRWPANIILDPYTAELLDEQSGTRQAGGFPKTVDRSNTTIYGKYASEEREQRINLDSGGASRFFYVAKASKRDRNEGLDELEAKTASEMTGRKKGSAGLVMKHEDGSDKANAYAGTTGAARQNFHPTVKPTSLMEYLVKLVTPPGGVVLDPFTGSGSTGKAAILQGFDFIGIEMTEEYLPIIEGRLKHAEALVAERIKETTNQQSEVLF